MEKSKEARDTEQARDTKQARETEGTDITNKTDITDITKKTDITVKTKATINKNNLKFLLILQSFLPLYFLVMIRCFSESRCQLIIQFFSELFNGNIEAIGAALSHPEIFATVLLCLCLLVFVFSLYVYFSFEKTQRYGFHEECKKIVIDADLTENSVVFFVTYITPFVLDDINQCSGFLSFITIVILLILLMRNTNLYYQNPFLTILGYRTFHFHFEGENDTKVGITRGKLDTSKIIKLKRISDNVYLVFNKN